MDFGGLTHREVDYHSATASLFSIVLGRNEYAFAGSIYLHVLIGTIDQCLIGFFHIETCLRAHCEKGKSLFFQPLDDFLSLCRRFFLQVGFVSQQYPRHSRVENVLDLLHPILQTLQRLIFRQGKHHEDAVRPSKEILSDGSVSILARGVPQLHLHIFSLDLAYLALVISANGGGGGLFEGSFDDSKEDAGLADGTISDKACFNFLTHQEYLQQAKSILILLMLRPKHRFYQLSEREKEGEKINDIYKLISLQEETMAQLLNKYQDKDARQQYQLEGKTQYLQESRAYQESRTLDTSSLHETATVKRGRSSTKIEHMTLQLPNISPNRSLPKKRHPKKSKEEINGLNPYFMDVKGEKEKAQLRDHLSRAYGTEKLKKSRSKSRIESIQKEPESKKIQPTQSQRLPRNQFSSRQVTKQRDVLREETKAQNDLPSPLGYFKQNVDQDSSSEEGQVPLSYYQRQFRTTIRSQCLQQTNFLYFSKNESIKDWTEGLLMLFQKHDKELHSLRRKCKYLQKFDDNFFSIDIFKEQ